MSFFTVVRTELKNKELLIKALEELKERGEITEYELLPVKDKIRVDRDGDILTLVLDETGCFQIQGDARVVSQFSKRLKQIYAYVGIKEHLPLDFEIAEEKESAGSISILLKG